MLNVQIKKQLSRFMLDVQFRVSGEIVALYGPSGSGKTTTLHSIAGLTKVDDGRIQLHNRTLTENGRSVIPVEKRSIGYVFQDYALFPHKTVWQNIAYGMKDEAATKQLSERLNIHHLLERYPHEISGGEQQRTAFIRALATEPQLLLLDEPFSALDDSAKRLSYEQLTLIQKEKNIPTILVTHQKEDISHVADRQLIIEDGIITAEKHIM